LRIVDDRDLPIAIEVVRRPVLVPFYWQSAERIEAREAAFSMGFDLQPAAKGFALMDPEFQLVSWSIVQVVGLHMAVDCKPAWRPMRQRCTEPGANHMCGKSAAMKVNGPVIHAATRQARSLPCPRQ